MTTRIARRFAALGRSCRDRPRDAGLAQDKTVKIGVLNDMSSLYADIGGPNSVVAVKMAVEDSGLTKKGWKIDVVSGDHQNKPDVGVNIARQWIDIDKVDAIADTPNSGVALAVSNLVKEKNAVLLNSGARHRRSHRQGLHAEHGLLHLRHLHAGERHRQGADQGRRRQLVLPDRRLRLRRTRWSAIPPRSSPPMAARCSAASSIRSTPSDFSSFLLQAQASKAKVIGLANAGGDTTNSIKQAAEFGIVAGGQKLAALLLFINDVHSLGLKTAQGLTFTESFYWDMNDETRAWSKRFAALASKGAMPSMTQAGNYAMVLHYLKAMEALGGNPHDGAKVVAKMKELPTDDPLFGKGPLRADGRRLIPAYLFEVKKPEESKGPWDYYKQIATIAPEDAAKPLETSECPLVKK